MKINMRVKAFTILMGIIVISGYSERVRTDRV